MREYFQVSSLRSLSRFFKSYSTTPVSTLKLEGNIKIYNKFLEFSKGLKECKDNNPLSPPFDYYPYGTIHNIAQILPVADTNGVDLLSCIENKTILDLGTGDGELSFFFEFFNPKKIIAIDNAPFNFNHLNGFRSLHRLHQSNVELIDADFHYIDLKKLPNFDTTFCLGFLYHSPHPMWVLEKISHYTRMLFLNTKVFDSKDTYAYFYDIAECNNDPSNWWCYSPKTVDLMLKRAGFKVQFEQRLDSNIGKSHPVNLSRDGRLLVYAYIEVNTDTEASIHKLTLGDNSA